MKPKAALLFLLVSGTTAGASFAQITTKRIATTPTTVNIRAINPSADSLKVMGARNKVTMVNANSIKQTMQLAGAKYAAYKTGVEIPANYLGSGDEKSLFRVTINGSWSVSDGAIALLPGNEGMISYKLKLENGKKYVLKLLYTKEKPGSLLVHNQIALTNYNDIVQDDVMFSIAETKSFSKPSELSFIITPYVYDDIKRTKYTPGAEVECIVQISLGKENGVTKNNELDYNMNVLKLVIKEIDF
ncbi:hypothetical protein ESA94_08635 [Lacibacter luteus]|uniref:DUF4138 domain-containing protein n=1 Tax=Lacibacter luteus TaxID=2508719 RepID=A0A4V1M7L8_9BACT|nr:hypothetical protein [Lacibacter luteus]RXK60525.1 hypothetical protein ESA94_08635 [Lacibacter luteus]